MPKRLQLSTDTADWAAEVAGASIRLTPGEALLTVARVGDRLQVEGLAQPMTGAAVAAGDEVWVTVAGEVCVFTVTHGSHKPRETRDHDAFTPPMSATVVRIAVKVGDQVRDGDVLIALEAMKMELPIRAPADAKVAAVHCREGEIVQPDTTLVELE